MESNNYLKDLSKPLLFHQKVDEEFKIINLSLVEEISWDSNRQITFSTISNSKHVWEYSNLNNAIADYEFICEKLRKANHESINKQNKYNKNKKSCRGVPVPATQSIPFSQKLCKRKACEYYN